MPKIITKSKKKGDAYVDKNVKKIVLNLLARL